jgi:hypothetical protein
LGGGRAEFSDAEQKFLNAAALKKLGETSRHKTLSAKALTVREERILSGDVLLRGRR